MGNFDRPVTKYLYVNEGSVSYYQGNPLPTSSNISAHKKLKEILNKWLKLRISIFLMMIINLL